MKSYYSKIFKKSKIRRKATLSALDLGEKFSYSALNNSRIISKLSEYSAWKARSDDNDRDMVSLEDAIAKDFIALVNQNLQLSGKIGESNDLHAQYQARIFDLEEQVRIFSREKANIMEEYRVLDSNYKFISLKNEQLSNYCANLQEQLRAASHGQIDLKELRKSNELEFICHKLQKKLEDLENENRALKSLVDKRNEQSTNEPVNPSMQIFTLRDLPKKNLSTNDSAPFKVPKVEDDLYIPQTAFRRKSESLDVIHASVQTDMGFDILKLEHAYIRLKKKNRELVKNLERYQGKIQKETEKTHYSQNEAVDQISDLASEISVLGLKPHTVARKEVGDLNASRDIKDSKIKTFSTTSITIGQTEMKSLDKNLITLHKEIQNRDQNLIKVRNEFRTMEEALKKEIMTLDQDMLTMQNKYHLMEATLTQELESRDQILVKVRDERYQMEQAHKKEVEHRDQDLVKAHHEYQELIKIYDESNTKNHVLKEQLENITAKLDFETEQMLSCRSEKEALEYQLNISLKEISRLKEEISLVPNNYGSTPEYEKIRNDYVESNKLIESLRKEIITNQEGKAHYAAECDKLLAREKSLDDKVTEYSQTLLGVRQEYRELSILYEENMLKKDELTREVSDLQNELEQANTALSGKNSKFTNRLNETVEESIMSNENVDEEKSLTVSKMEIESYKEKLENYVCKYNEVLAKYESLHVQTQHTEQLLSTIRHEYQELSIAHDEINLKNVEMSESLDKLQCKLESMKDKNKSLSAERADFENLLNVSKKEILSLKQMNENMKESIPRDEFCKLKTEYDESKSEICSLQKENSKYRSEIERLTVEYQDDSEKKESLLKEIKFLDQEVSNRDRLVSDLRNEKNKLQIDLNEEIKSLGERIKSIQEEKQILRTELDSFESQYSKLYKEHEEEIKFSSEKDQRIRETFSEFVRINNQLKSEQAHRIEMEKTLRNDLKVALDEKNALINKGPSKELITLQKELKATEEKLFSLGIKYGQLETEMERKELIHKEDMDEADSNLERLLQKYDDLSQKAILLETLYREAQTEFANTRRIIR